MKTRNLIAVATLLLAGQSNIAYANNASAASQHSGAASKHSVLSAYHGSAATVKVGSAIVAVPFVVAGVVGSISLNIGTELMDSASSGFTENGPLEITDKTITTAPSPKEAMRTTPRITQGVQL
jgi:hypothetical protein